MYTHIKSHIIYIYTYIHNIFCTYVYIYIYFFFFIYLLFIYTHIHITSKSHSLLGLHRLSWIIAVSWHEAKWFQHVSTSEAAGKKQQDCGTSQNLNFRIFIKGSTSKNPISWDFPPPNFILFWIVVIFAAFRCRICRWWWLPLAISLSATSWTFPKPMHHPLWKGRLGWTGPGDSGKEGGPKTRQGRQGPGKYRENGSRQLLRRKSSVKWPFYIILWRTWWELWWFASG